MTKHTQIPWVASNRWIGVPNHKSYIGQCYDANGNWATDSPMAIANAEFIVRAVNSHDALVEALEEAQKALSNHWFYYDEYGEGYNNDDVIDADKKCQIALALVKGE